MGSFSYRATFHRTVQVCLLWWVTESHHLKGWVEELYLRLESLYHGLGEEVVDHHVGDGLPLRHQAVQLQWKSQSMICSVFESFENDAACE